MVPGCPCPGITKSLDPDGHVADSTNRRTKDDKGLSQSDDSEARESLIPPFYSSLERTTSIERLHGREGISTPCSITRVIRNAAVRAKFLAQRIGAALALGSSHVHPINEPIIIKSLLYRVVSTDD